MRTAPRGAAGKSRRAGTGGGTGVARQSRRIYAGWPARPRADPPHALQLRPHRCHPEHEDRRCIYADWRLCVRHHEKKGGKDHAIPCSVPPFTKRVDFRAQLPYSPRHVENSREREGPCCPARHLNRVLGRPSQPCNANIP